jgi:hypothetical protein
MLLRKIKMGLIRYAFRGSYDSAGLWLAKRFNMEQEALKELLYSGTMALMKNSRYYYHSSIGAEYSHWTDAGVEALREYSNMLAFRMLEAEEKALNKRAKELVVKGLKGETI